LPANELALPHMFAAKAAPAPIVIAALTGIEMPASHSLPRFWVVIPAAGSGMRMGAAVPKQYLPLAGRTVIEHSMARLAALPGVAGLVVALAVDDPYWPTLKLQLGVPVQRITGGSERCHSVLAALTWLLGVAEANDWVLVHDAARPCVRRADLQRLLDTLADDPIGGLLAIPARDTKKRADANGRILSTVDRTDLWKAQTPQMFRLGALHEALSRAIAAGVLVTDEASAMEYAGLMPRLVEGHSDNIKITRPEDLMLAEFYIAQQD